MKSQDWHEALKSLTFADTASGQEVCEKSTGAEDKAVTVQKSPIHIVLERKGRGGKTATIICDLQLDDNDLKNLAADIKKTLGCGGSARDGEILIQGDRTADCKKLLENLGYKVK